MSTPQVILTLSHLELAHKLHTIAQTLQQQQQQMRNMYRNRIEQLEMDLEEKDKILDRLRLEIICFEDRIEKYQDSIKEKDKVIEELNTKVLHMQDFVKEKLYCFIDQFDLSCTSIDNSGLKDTSSTTHKDNKKYHNFLYKYLEKQQEIKNKINISQYFMKSIENSRVSTKIKTTHEFDTPSVHSNSVSNVNLKNKSNWYNSLKEQLKLDSDPYLSVSAYASTPKLEKVKSMEQFRKKSQWNSEAPRNDKTNKIQPKESQNYNQFQYSKKNSLNSQQYLQIHGGTTNKPSQIKRKKSQIHPVPPAQPAQPVPDQRALQRQKQRAMHKEKLKILAIEPKSINKYNSPRHHQFMQKWKKVSAFQEPNKKYL